MLGHAHRLGNQMQSTAAGYGFLTLVIGGTTYALTIDDGGTDTALTF